jgi:RNA polymerase sigma-70 factor (ECF subfamily)
VAQAILERVAAGDSQAVDDCMTTYRGLVWSLARRHLSNHSDAEDAVQEIFIDIWRNAGRFDPKVASEPTFISMIARRRLIDRHRKRSREIDTATLVEDAPIAAPPEEDHVEKNEEVARVREHMSQLRPEERRILELSTYQGMSQTRIAEVTDLPLGTVKTHARRGLLRLRSLLDVPSPQQRTTP